MRTMVTRFVAGTATLLIVGGATFAASPEDRPKPEPRPETPASRSGPYEDQYFDSAGVRIRYIDVGPRDGEPVLLIHGGAASIEFQWFVQV